MSEALIIFLRQSLPDEIASLTEPYLKKLEQGQYEELLRLPEAQALFGHSESPNAYTELETDCPAWNDLIFHRLGTQLADRSRPALGNQVLFFSIGYAALLAFLQSNVTGPPLAFDPATVVLPRCVSDNVARTKQTRHTLLKGLGMDGIAAYQLTPNIELLCLAEAIMTTPPIIKNVKAARWAKLRIAFVQQRLLSEVSSTLQDVIYDDLALLDEAISALQSISSANDSIHVEFFLERAAIHTHHGLAKLARTDIDHAKEIRRFDFALTGVLGKRTKFQQKDISQLVVLAKSDEGASHANGDQSAKPLDNAQLTSNGPKALDLNDDTLLESIAFTRKPDEPNHGASEVTLPQGLASINPSNQPQLQALDSIILLAFASSITNTSPQHGLTREETLPYATRVLEGGSNNWQVYTQALLVRSRIEGYKSRTTERGLLQLQALVDQVVADTTGSGDGQVNGAESRPATFLPKATNGEDAPVQERLRYLFQLASPSRWELEAELAARWVQLGGLRSALDLYERLEMWAEAALCWAATDREDKARTIVRRQLFHATGSSDETDEDETWAGTPRDPPPTDAPRLYCILGDIDQDPEMYEEAWRVSGQRYARAQRSIGRYYYSKGDHVKAAGAYSKSLKANQLNHASWFALGCALLELSEYAKAAEAFSRCVQLDETDAEAWSNLAAALMRIEPDTAMQESETSSIRDDEDESFVRTDQRQARSDMQKNRIDALRAFKRAASLKQDAYRIWQNVLIVAASLSPPDYQSVLTAQKRIIDLRGSVEGEKCIDFEILEQLVQHVISSTQQYDASAPGLSRLVVKLIDESVVPLITASASLWRLVSKLAVWRNRPSSALDAEEKAWRVVTSQPGWETESEGRWNDVVDATIRLCDSYESLGPRERTEGMGAGEPVAKDWRFKARSAIRGIAGRGKSSWDGTGGWERLQQTLRELRN